MFKTYNRISKYIKNTPLEYNIRLSKRDERIRDTFMKNYFVESKFINKNISKEKFIYSGKISWRFLLKHSYLMNN